ncbi:MAG: hypothetical protein IT435_03175 [Phycisphaerales bacterium]|nr:hypothetical protein [Phycisphaerales bacterium]
MIVDARDQELVRTVRLALKLGRRHLSEYAHVNAPKKFTQPQLFACLRSIPGFWTEQVETAAGVTKLVSLSFLD